MPAPLVEFTRFAQPQTWWLRRGPPPWLEDPRRWVRAFRASLLLGLMGTVTGWGTVAGFYAMSLVHNHFNGRVSETLQQVFGLYAGPGFWFGIGVLIPLARWLGRRWSLCLLSVPLAMFACYCGVVTFFKINPILGSGPDWIPGGERACGFYAGFVGAAIIGLGMGHPGRKISWLATGCAALLASVGCGLIFLHGGNLGPSSGRFSDYAQWMNFVAPYVMFQSLTAIGLGTRLWWGESVSARNGNDH